MRGHTTTSDHDLAIELENHPGRLNRELSLRVCWIPGVRWVPQGQKFVDWGVFRGMTVGPAIVSEYVRIAPPAWVGHSLLLARENRVSIFR